MPRLPSLPHSASREQPSWAFRGAAVLAPPANAAVCHPACSHPFPDPDVYVADSGSASVTVIDAATDAVVATVAVGSDPTGVAVDPVTRDVYVADTDSDSVSVISASTDTVSATIELPAGSAPTGLASTPNGSTVYVADSGTGRVSVIATSTGTVTGSIAVGSSPGAVAVAPGGGSVYVTNALSDTVSVITTGSGKVTKTITVGYFPSAVAVNPVGNYVYVTNQCGKDPNCFSPGTLSVIAAATAKVSHTYQVGYEPVGVSITPDAATLYVVNACGPGITPAPKPLPRPDCGDVDGADPANVTTFDAASMTVDFDPSIDSAEPGVVEGTATSPDGTSMFVANCADPIRRAARVARSASSTRISVPSRSGR